MGNGAVGVGGVTTEVDMHFCTSDSKGENGLVGKGGVDEGEVF